MSPRSRSLNERLREESRRAIMQHALHLFGARGYEATTVKMIARAVGISPGLVYHYFASKERLLIAIYEESMRDVHRSLAEAEAAPTPRERIEALIRSSFRTVRENLDFWRLSYGSRMQGGVVAALGERVPEWAEAIRESLARHFREAGAERPEEEAALLFALLDGANQHFALDPDRYPLERITDAIVGAYRGAAGAAVFTGASTGGGKGPLPAPGRGVSGSE